MHFNLGHYRLMIKLIVQRNYSIFNYIIVLIIILFFAGVVSYFMYSSDIGIDAAIRTYILELLCIIIFLTIPFIFFSINNRSVYVSDLLISEEYIELFYKIANKEVNNIRIWKKEIVSFNVSVKVSSSRKGIYPYIKSNIDVTISLVDGENVEFSILDNQVVLGCTYQFILDLLKYRTDIPNFSYNVTGTEEYAIEDIKYYDKYGCRLPFSKVYGINIQKSNGFVKFLFLLMIIFIITAFVYYADILISFIK